MTVVGVQAGGRGKRKGRPRGRRHDTIPLKSRDVADDPAPARSTQSKQTSQAYRFWHSAWHAALGSVALGVVTSVGFFLHADDASAALLYLFVVVLTSLRAGLVAGLIVSGVAIVCLDYFFTPPLFRVQIGEIDAVAMIVFGTTVLVINHLMTRVRKSFEEIQRSEATLREQAGLLDLAHDSVFVRDMNSVITYWNRGAEELYGWRRDEAVGKVTHELLQTAFPVPREEITAALLRTAVGRGSSCTPGAMALR